ncbi:MAG: AraC family transcriptional regulator [Lachnospiraceae bacterium]|nr:AraC family transcriptional regulator [Lachnospiraceae bacterium]
MAGIEKELAYREYVMREELEYHAPYNPEREFYDLVRAGDEKRIEKSLKEDFCDKKGLGVLSGSKLQNFKYHFVITAAMLSRVCISGGMEHEQAYTISDLYIRQMDEARNLPEISRLHKQMVRDYTKRMKRIVTSKVYSRHVVRAIHYIYDHLHERIYLSDLAEEAGINENYLSRLFKKETGMSVSRYIMAKKIETAKNMMEYSEYTPAEIANILAFPSQSYFVKVFHAECEMTPGQYYTKFCAK